jgi:outer membrane protein assembly factor BamD
MRMNSSKIIWPLLAVSFVLSSCGRPEEETPLAEQPPQQIFETAEVELERGKAEKAAALFADVERLYPYSEWAKRALIMSAFANHQDGNYEQSRSDAQRYLDFYPADEDAAYAQYLMALSFYDQIDNVSRDQGVTFQALQALRTVIERYPDSEFATSSLLKFDLALDHLAGKEMEIGRYYLKRGHFGAAINRFRVVVEEFQTTSHTPEALHRLVEAYLSLGLNADAQTAGAILGHNFGASDWFQDSHVLLTGQGLSTEAGDKNATKWLRTIWRRVAKGKWL